MDITQKSWDQYEYQVHIFSSEWCFETVSGCALLWRRTGERPHQRPLPLRLLTPSCLSRAVAWQCWGGKQLSLCRGRRKLEWCCLLASLNLSLNVIAAPVLHTVNHVEIEMFMLGYGLYKKLPFFRHLNPFVLQRWSVPLALFSAQDAAYWHHSQPNASVNRLRKLQNVILSRASPHHFHPSVPKMYFWACSAVGTFNLVHDRWCYSWHFSSTVLLIILDCFGQPNRMMCIYNT